MRFFSWTTPCVWLTVRLFRLLKHGIPARREFETLDDANRGAKDIASRLLTHPIPRGFSLVHLANSDKNYRPDYSFKPEPSDTKPQLVETSETGLETYKAKYFLHCDPYGAGLCNLVAVSLTCRLEPILIHGDRRWKLDRAVGDAHEVIDLCDLSENEYY